MEKTQLDRGSGPIQDSWLGTFHGLDPKCRTRKVRFLVSARDNSFSISVNGAYSVAILNIDPGELNVEQLQSRWGYLSNLDLPPVDSEDVTILLGNNVLPAHAIFDSRRPKIRGEAPEAILTRLVGL